ncbi:Thiamine-triphosphatase [Porphyridium purpureum]|uniref:Thiamine-triphosphatase n=1 Tax=Porphyridium purpureum TaxID=35688 RepID=A0A5J4YZR3_PORPP|nr:Thiamine-triphosphatase [Porphyridium purpureum]|eukprot:POR3534..scf209_3
MPALFRTSTIHIVDARKHFAFLVGQAHRSAKCAGDERISLCRLSSPAFANRLPEPRLAMIEVERRVEYDDLTRGLLLEGAQLIGNERVEDVYFDTERYSVTSRDWWLRLRKRGEEKTWQLKVPAQGGMKGSAVDTYIEIEEPLEIARLISQALEGKETRTSEMAADDLGGALKFLGLRECISIETMRESHQKEFCGCMVRIDLDRCSFGYQVAELEIMVEDHADKTEMAKAAALLEDFIQAHGLQNRSAESKLLRYIKTRAPNHRRALESCGILPAS